MALIYDYQPDRDQALKAWDVSNSRGPRMVEVANRISDETGFRISPTLDADHAPLTSLLKDIPTFLNFEIFPHLVDRAVDEVSDKILQGVFDQRDGILVPGMPKMSLDAFKKMFVPPRKSIIEYCGHGYAIKHSLLRLSSSSRKLVTSNFTIRKGTLNVDPDSRQQVSDALTLFASDRQRAFHEEACELLKQLAGLEFKYRQSTGFIVNSLHDGRYEFNLKQLAHIK
ncbi:hypothetical protein WBG78_26055 [Chryseolinea sp. T2]|uniref:hypothetical protein n=1 Tax=Chryseolinea sp. T2 TaxID=3129255 RepID=UPI003077A409